MNKTPSLFWLLIIFIFVLPTSIGRLFIDMIGGIMMLFIFISILIVGVGWLSWRRLKSSLINCPECGTAYLASSQQCHICGSSKNNAIENNNNSASSPVLLGSSGLSGSGRSGGPGNGKGNCISLFLLINSLLGTKLGFNRGKIYL